MHSCPASSAVKDPNASSHVNHQWHINHEKSCQQQLGSHSGTIQSMFRLPLYSIVQCTNKFKLDLWFHRQKAVTLELEQRHITRAYCQVIIFPVAGNVSPLRISGSSSQQWTHTSPDQSCTCEQSPEPMDHQGSGPSKGSKLRVVPENSKHVF